MGERLAEKLGKDTYENCFTVRFKITPKRLRRWSLLTKQEVEWAKEVAILYNRAFSFPILRAELEKKWLQ